MGLTVAWGMAGVLARGLIHWSNAVEDYASRAEGLSQHRFV